MKQKGFTLIELIVVIVILGILVVAAVPRYFSFTTDARLAILNDMYGQTKSMTTNINAMKQIPNRIYESNGGEYLRYTVNTDLKLKSDFLYLGDVCKALGITDTTMESEGEGVEHESYICRWEADKVSIEVAGLSKNQCYLSYAANNYTSAPTTKLACEISENSECLCP